VLDLPYITGGQVVVQWADLEPAEGTYDFAPLEAAMHALGDRPATLQVNGNRKPAWLFDVVPYCQEKLGEQVADKQGTLMYWHPRHQQAYLNFLRAFGDFVKAVPWREQVLGIRLNFNALGTEHWRVAAEDRDLGKWITPPGATTGTAWTMELGTAYRREVLRAFVDAFAPTVRVFVRNNIERELREPFEARFRSGELAWFHTSTEIEPRAAWGEWQYQTFLDYCRNGTTVGYAEQWASAWGHHGGVTDPRWCSPPQWNYWRLLADLHCGVSFIGVYGSDLTVAKHGTYRRKPVPQYQDEFRRAFEFAARYAGYHASPKQSPGAWVAFREGTFLKGDYNFLMERLPDDSTERRLVGPEQQRFGAWARAIPAGATMRLRPDREFVQSLAGGPGQLRIVYLDSGTDSLTLSLQDLSWEIPRTDTGHWREYLAPIDRFPAIVDGQSLELSLRGGSTEAILHMVELARGDSGRRQRLPQRHASAVSISGRKGGRSINWVICRADHPSTAEWQTSWNLKMAEYEFDQFVLKSSGLHLIVVAV
jgi:hypothetical protein